MSGSPDRLQTNGERTRTGPPSTGDLVAEILDDSQDLLEQQFELAREQILLGLQRTRDAGYFVGLGGLFGILGMLLLMPFLIGLLAGLFPQMPWWGWCGTLALAFLSLGVWLYFDAWRRLKSFHPLRRWRQQEKESTR